MLNEIRNTLARMAFGMTVSEAHQRGVCISCKQPPDLSTDLAKSEYRISATCGSCFDRMAQEK